MKTLDEILENWLENAYSTSSLGVSPVEPENDEDREARYNKYLKKAKQAIIDLIEGEIIGEDEKPENNRDLFAYERNGVKEEQRQKLQKLKE